MKIAVSAYSFSRDLSSGKLTLVECIGKAKEIGFSGIEFIDLPGETFEERKTLAQELRHEADRLGMKIVAYTVGANLFTGSKEGDAKEVERIKTQVDIAEVLGADLLRHDVCYSVSPEGDGRSFDLMLPTIASNAHEIAEYAQAKGIKTCTENHGYIAQDSDRVERLFNSVNHENYGLLVDIGNFVCADEDSAHAVSVVAPYAIHVHAKDMLVRKEANASISAMTRGGNYFCGTAVGEGDVDVRKCLKILKRAGYDGWYSIEFEGHGDCVDGIQRGFNNLKMYLEELN